MKKGVIKKIRKRHIFFFIISLIIIFFLLSYKSINNNYSKTVREPAVAGTWYPGDKTTLSKTIDQYFQNTNTLEFEGEIKALIVPHAGYIYSGQVAAHGFNQLRKNYKKIFLIGTNHVQNANINGISIPDVTHYKTPLGEVKVSKISKELLKEDLFTTVPKSHTSHILEIELPFLQTKLDDFELIPMVTGLLNYDQIKQTADLISQHFDKDSLLVISSDLSHFHTYQEAVELDTTCIQDIASKDIEKTSKCEACGLYAIMIGLELAKRNNWDTQILDYKNSGDITGDHSRVVGYSSIVFYESNKEKLSLEEKQILLTLARQKLNSIYTKEPLNFDTIPITDSMKKTQGCFTTLNKNHNLRGCIGHILPQEELYKCVIDNAENAALHDRRFQPVTQDELKDIEVEISVLSVPEKLTFSSPEDLLEKLRPMVDGVVIKKRFYQSTYLPQVWESFTSKEQFLGSLCQKAGLTLECWKDKNIEVYTYQADVFDESLLE